MLTYKGGRYFWWALFISTLSLVLYLYHEPFDGANGGTWLGYFLGTLGAILVFWLTYFGIRKRHYTSSLGSVSGWLSAHVYLGLSLIFIATLHSAFQFGWNIHTYTYVLMWAVILSGCYGVFSYLYYPRLLASDGDSSAQEKQFLLLKNLDKESLELSALLGEKVHDIVLESLEKSKIPQGLFRQLFLDPLLGDWALAAKSSIAGMVAQSNDVDESRMLREVANILYEKCEIVSQIHRGLRAKARMEVWLYFHVPLTFALLGCLIAHIVSVFFFW